MFQSLFLLPVPENTETYVREVLVPSDMDFRELLQQRFGLPGPQWPHLVQTLDQNLPHNPRKIKAFVSTWKLYLHLLASQRPAGIPLDRRLTVILNYLGQFEEPLFRKIEEAPGFYSDHVVRFCRDGTSTHPLFDGLELPYRATEAVAEATGGLESPVSSVSSLSTSSGAGDSESPKPSPFNMVTVAQ